MWRLIVLVLAMLAAVVPTAAQQLTVTYLANEGVMLTCGNDKLLIDALFRKSISPYPEHSPDSLTKIEGGRVPFDNVRLALVTHFHADHWDKQSGAAFLEAHPIAKIGGPEQVTSQIPESLKNRVVTFSGRTGQVDSGNFEVEAIPLAHSAPSRNLKVENLAYRVTACGRTVMHLGDAFPINENFEALARLKSPDVALVPMWWFLDANAAKFMRERWKPRTLAAFHFGTNARNGAKEIQDAWPSVWTMMRVAEQRTF